MTLKAWGMTINFKIKLVFKPKEAAASFCPFPIASMPALTHSAINVAVYNDKAKSKAINSGGISKPPLKV